MITKKLFSAFLAICLAIPALGETVLVKGKVVDSKGEPMIGAVVLVKGTTNGTMVADDGSYSLKAPAHSILQASLLGYSTEEQEVGGRTAIDFVLKNDSVMLQESVVEVGYGEQRLVDLTGTVGRVNMDELAKAPIASAEQALQGRIAGVNISANDGQPGSEMNVVIRGANSLTQSNAPLYVVDGFPLEDYSASAISPNDIASITVLKDASSTAIYGSRGANGVIIIETKKGKAGKAQVTYNMVMGIHQASKQMELMDASDYVNLMIERIASGYDSYLTKTGRNLEDYRTMETINWQDRLFRNAFAQTHNLSVMGGNSTTRYAVAGSIVDQDGVISNSGYKRYQGRIAIEQKLSKTVRMNANMSYTDAITSGQASADVLMTGVNAATSNLMYRVWAFRPVSLTDDDDDEIYDGMPTSGTMNPVISNENEMKERQLSTFKADAKITWQITPDLVFKATGGFYKNDSNVTEFNNSKTQKGFPRVGNALGVNGSVIRSVGQNYMNENTLTYSKEIGKQKLSLLGGFTIQKNDVVKTGFSSSQIPNDKMGFSGMDDGLPQSITTTLSGNTLMSFLSRINYQYDSRYLLTVSFRADGSSKFSAGNKWGYFPSAAFAWRLGQEPWMKNISWIDDAKIRLSYGLTGNNRVGDYASYATLTMNDMYAIGNSPGNAISQSTLGNMDLKWETTAQSDLGFDLRLFESRISLTADLYHKVTSDLLLNANVPYSSGFAKVMKNVGKICNDGLEITLNTVNIRTRDFQWTSDFNIAFNRDKVLELAEGQESILSNVSFSGGYSGTFLYIAQLGKPVASFYGLICDGVYGLEDFDYTASGQYILKEGVPTNGSERSSILPGDIKYRDINGDGVVNTSDQVVLGRCAPIHTGGFNNTFTWKNFSLNVFLQWSYGNQIMNANRIVFEGNDYNRAINQFASYNDRWSISNQDSRNFRVGGQGPVGFYSSRTLEDGSYLRLKTLQMSYNLPKKITTRIKAESIQFVLAAQNLLTFTSYSGLDPEVSTKNTALTPGFDYSAYPHNRVLSGGLNITF